MPAVINNPFVTANSAQPTMGKPQQPLVMDPGPQMAPQMPPPAPMPMVAPQPAMPQMPALPPQAMGGPGMGMPMGGPQMPQVHPALLQMLARIPPEALARLFQGGMAQRPFAPLAPPAM